jgi:hypothetical protein
MAVIKKLTVAVGVGGATMFLAVPASAQSGDNPCDLAITFLCRFVPIAPDLEGDVDLTNQLPPADPNAPLPEALPPVNPCAAGCI